MGKSLMRKIFFVKDNNTNKSEFISALNIQEALQFGSVRMESQKKNLSCREFQYLKKRYNYKT